MGRCGGVCSGMGCGGGGGSSLSDRLKYNQETKMGRGWTGEPGVWGKGGYRGWGRTGLSFECSRLATLIITHPYGCLT